jgi:hypothetical protein
MTRVVGEPATMDGGEAASAREAAFRRARRPSKMGTEDLCRKFSAEKQSPSALATCL